MVGLSVNHHLVVQYYTFCLWYLLEINALILFLILYKENQFIGAVKAGLLIGKATKQENILSLTISNFWAKVCKTGFMSNLPHFSHLCKVIEHTKRNIEHEVCMHCCEPLEEVGHAVESQVSTSIVWNVLAEKSYYWRVAREVTWLIQGQKKARMAWARKNKNMGEKEWTKTIWSDESYVYIRDNHGQVYITHYLDKVLREECTV